MRRLVSVFIAILVLSLLLPVGLWWYMIVMPGQSYSGERMSLVPEEISIREQLKNHVSAIATHDHNVYEYANLNMAAAYIEKVLGSFQYSVQSQSFLSEGKQVRNIFVEIPGMEYPDQIVVIGAHYDSVEGSPGANDNGSGTAAVIELARMLKEIKLKRTVRLVFFANEEPPFFQTKLMGSEVYAAAAYEKKENIVAMLSIETIGFYSDEPESQQYPFPFNLLYPDTGNFIAFVANLNSRDLLHKSITAFRKNTRFPSEGVAAPEFIPGIDWSDQWGFWKRGYQALMITDTAPFRYAYYHTTEDTPDKLDYERMARVVSGILEVVKELANK